MDRLHEVPQEERTPEQAALYRSVVEARGRFYSPYKVWIHSPQIGFGMETIGTYLNSKSAALSAAEMELVALLTARFWGADYVIKNHVGHARRAGLPEATIEALVAGQEPHIDDERQRAVQAFVSGALRRETPSDIDFERYVAVLTCSGLADVLATIGYRPERFVTS
jgi:4-carboxymuconolactone decarboxylase